MLFIQHYICVYSYYDWAIRSSTTELTLRWLKFKFRNWLINRLSTSEFGPGSPKTLCRFLSMELTLFTDFINKTDVTCLYKEFLRGNGKIQGGKSTKQMSRIKEIKMKGLVKYMSQIVIIVTIKLKTHCTVSSRNTLYNNKMTKKTTNHIFNSSRPNEISERIPSYSEFS